MRGLYDIPTDARTSSWYLVEGTLRFWPDKTATGDVYAGVADLVLPSGSVIRILPTWKYGKLFRVLYQAVGRAGTAPVRVLIRRIERQDCAAYWDVALSPNDELTISVAVQCIDALGKTAFDSLVKALLAEATSIAWPSWVPNDEERRPAPRSTPRLKHPEVWETLVSIIKETLAVEEDQVFWDLRLDLLESDSLDAVEIVMDLEKELEIDISDELAEELWQPFTNGGTLGDVYTSLIEILEKSRSGSS